MSMPITGDPAGNEPAAPAAGELPGSAEEFALHPSWDPVLKDLEVLPESFRAPFVEKIKDSEKNFKQALEEARSKQAPDEWRDFLEQAGRAEATPAALIQAWNSAQAILTDPIAFHIQLTDIIDQRMALPATDPMHLTAREGYRAKQQVAESTAVAAGAGDPFESDEAKALREVRDQMKAMQDAQAAQAAAQEAERAKAADEAKAQAFLTALNTEMEGAPDALKLIVGQAASSSILNGVDPAQAVKDAVAAAKAGGITWTAPASAGEVPVVPPVGGGGAGAPVETPKPLPPVQTKEGRDAREAAMIAAAQAALG